MTNLTDEQVRRLISTDFDNSYFVEASAGAGKTRCLVDRLVHLMLEKQVNPASVVAITFTNKAAQEFRERVETEVARRLMQKDELSAEQQAQLQFVAEHLDQCYMGTIHSFCLQILREHPVESGLDLVIDSMDEGQSQAFLEDFWNSFLEANEAADPAFIALRKQNQAPASVKEVFNMMHRYRDLLPFQQAFTSQELAASFPDTMPAHLAAIEKELWQEYGVIKNHDLIKFSDDKGNPSKTNQERYRVIEAYLQSTHGKPYQRAYDAARAIEAVLMLQMKNDKALSADEKRMKKQFSDRYASKNNPAALLQLLTYYQKCRYHLLQTTLSSMVKQVEEQRRQAGLLDFQDILITTRQLLQHNQHVRQLLQDKYQYFFVDEFQDTDPLQTDIIMQLVNLQTRPASLFIVGDKKQSIYRFNRADVINFNNTKNKLKQQVKCVTLTKNFRTVPALCHWFNGAFSQLLPTGLEEGSQAAYTAIEPHRETEEREAEPALNPQDCLEGVFQYIFQEPSEEEEATGSANGKNDWNASKERYAEAEAKVVAELIQRLKTMEVLDMGNDRIRILKPEEADKYPQTQRRALAYSGIMAITGNKKGLAVYSRVFQSRGIPVVVDGETTLQDSRAAEELLKVLKALENPFESLYTVSVLRSALFGLSDQELYDYASLMKNTHTRWNYLKTRPSSKHSLKKAARPTHHRLRKNQLKHWQKVRRAMDQLRRFHRWSTRCSPVTLLEKLVEALHLVPMAVVMEGDQPALHIFYQMIELLRQEEIQGDIQSLSDLLKKIQAYKVKFESKQISLEQERDALRLMNLHKAKGLEAPVVILLHNREKVGRSKAACHVKREEIGGILQSQVYQAIAYADQYKRLIPLAPTPSGWEEQLAEEEKLLAEEHLRKVYVGYTRAENLLLLGVPAIVENTPSPVEEPTWLHHLAERGLLESIPVLEAASLPEAILPVNEKGETACDHVLGLAQVQQQQQKLAATTRIRRAHASPSTLVLTHRKDAQTIHAEVLTQREKVFMAQQEEEISLEEITAQDNPYGDLWGTLVHGLMEKVVLHRQHLQTLDSDNDALKEYLASLAAEVLGSTLTEDTLRGKTFWRMYRQLMGVDTEDALETMDMEKALTTLQERLVTAALNLMNNHQPQQNTTVANLWQEITEAAEVYPEMPFSLLVTQDHPLFQLWKDTQLQKNSGESDLESVEEVLFTGIMDLVYCHQGQWKIVDYKTNREQQGVDLHQVYANQLKTYELAWVEMEGSKAESLVWRV